jgi:hypothetical protein
MNNLDQNSLNLVNIGRDHWDVPVRVDFRAYLDFTRRINIQLRRLIERWEHKASPAAKRLHTKNRPR